MDQLKTQQQIEGPVKDLHEANDSNNLDDGEDELGFTIALDAKHVDKNNDEEKDANEYGTSK
jgi:hypothetical protein